MAHKLLSYRQSTYLVATFKKSSNLVHNLKVGTLVRTLYVLWRHKHQTKRVDSSQLSILSISFTILIFCAVFCKISSFFHYLSFGAVCIKISTFPFPCTIFIWSVIFLRHQRFSPFSVSTLVPFLRHLCLTFLLIFYK